MVRKSAVVTNVRIKTPPENPAVEWVWAVSMQVVTVENTVITKPELLEGQHCHALPTHLRVKTLNPKPSPARPVKRTHVLYCKLASLCAWRTASIWVCYDQVKECIWVAFQVDASPEPFQTLSSAGLKRQSIFMCGLRT